MSAFMKSGSLVLLALATVILSGCKEIDVPNGEVPAEHLSTAQKYMGSYDRVDGRVPGTLNLSLSGQKVLATYNGALVDSTCQATIGDLKKIKVGEKNGVYRLKRAKFVFDPNRCATEIAGRQFVVYFSEQSGAISANAEVLIETRYERECRLEPGPPPYGGVHEVCNETPVYKFYRWKFVKR